jgi:hypothetical protein
VAFNISSERQEKIEHGKDEDRADEVGDEFVDCVYCFHDFIVLIEIYIVEDYFTDF